MKRAFSAREFYKFKEVILSITDTNTILVYNLDYFKTIKTIRESLINNDIIDKDSLEYYDVINYFDWSKTEEGHTYWEKIHDEVNPFLPVDGIHYFAFNSHIINSFPVNGVVKYSNHDDLEYILEMLGNFGYDVDKLKRKFNPNSGVVYWGKTIGFLDFSRNEEVFISNNDNINYFEDYVYVKPYTIFGQTYKQYRYVDIELVIVNINLFKYGNTNISSVETIESGRTQRSKLGFSSSKQLSVFATTNASQSSRNFFTPSSSARFGQSARSELGDSWGQRGLDYSNNARIQDSKTKV